MKQLVFFVFTLFIGNQLLAQGASFGIKGGTNYSIINIDKAIEDLKYTSGTGDFGFQAGAFFRVTAPFVYFQPEIMFTSSGGTINRDSISTSSVLALKYNRLDVPLSAGFKIAKVVRIGGALVGSILLSDDIRNDVAGAGEEIKAKLSTATVGYQAGIGLDISIVTIDLLYEGNLSAFGTSIEGYDTDYRNQQFKLNVGIKLWRKLSEK